MFETYKRCKHFININDGDIDDKSSLVMIAFS